MNMTGLLTPKFAGLYKALSHPMRLEILRMLSGKTLNVNDLGEKLNKRQSNVSQHLQTPRKNNLVSSNGVGKRRVYELNEQNKTLIRYLSGFKL